MNKEYSDDELRAMDKIEIEKLAMKLNETREILFDLLGAADMDVLLETTKMVLEMDEDQPLVLDKKKFNKAVYRLISMEIQK